MSLNFPISLVGNRFAAGPTNPPALPIEFVTVGDAGNATDPIYLYGDVSYEYRIAKYAIRESDIDAYNAATTPIITKDTRGDDKPALNLSWNEAARFVNWLNAFEGEQEAYKFDTGGYNDNITLWDSVDAWQDGGENLYRHKDAKYFLPSEDEWYKAAYYDPNYGGVGVGGYWDYATAQNIGDNPTAVASGTLPGTLVYCGQSGPADVDQAGGLSPYGTMGQGGNAYERLESAYTAPNATAAENRANRGGAWPFCGLITRSSRSSQAPTVENQYYGLRVAAIPE